MHFSLNGFRTGSWVIQAKLCLGSNSSAMSDKESQLASMYRPPLEIMFKGSFDYVRSHGLLDL
jgi:hypothetical protein